MLNINPFFSKTINNTIILYFILDYIFITIYSVSLSFRRQSSIGIYIHSFCKIKRDTVIILIEIQFYYASTYLLAVARILKPHLVHIEFTEIKLESLIFFYFNKHISRLVRYSYMTPIYFHKRIFKSFQYCISFFYLYFQVLLNTHR